MIRFLYNLLWPLGLVIFLPRYLVKMFRRGGYRESFGQRLGLYNRAVRRRLAGQNPTWLHAVSVGEVAIALKLAGAIQDLEPGARVVLTTTTTTGFAFARQHALDWMEVMYMPLDFWPVMRRGFELVAPRKIVLVEAEVWPNLVALAEARRIPVALVNARLSPRSERRFLRFRQIVSPLFRKLDLISVPEAEDVERWMALGVARDRIQHVGSIKYDTEQDHSDPALPFQVLQKLGIEAARPTIVGGSTHAGEEEILIEIYCQLRSSIPNLFLVLAPRHVERARDVQRGLENRGLSVALRSQSTPSKGTADCLVLDTTGELRNWYRVATVVFMGKSLTLHGGQNPAEAIMADKPVIFGPHMENFAVFARALLNRRGALEVRSATELQKAIFDLLNDGTARDHLVANAHAVLATHQGATARTAALLRGLQSRSS